MPASGFTEIVASVVDIDRSRVAFESVFGFRGEALPDGSPALFEAWSVPSGCRRIRQYHLTPENDHRGCIRLVEFQGAQRALMRPSQRTWDTGGLFDIDVYVKDARALAQALQLHGWIGFGEPVDYGWGGFEVCQWLAQSSDGLGVALLQPYGKVLIELPEFRAASRVFNGTQFVRDLDQTLEFYLGQLGWQVLVQAEVADTEEPGREVLGIPMPLAQSVSRRLAIVHPAGTNDGSVELIEMKEIAGHHWGERCRAPNIGWLALRFPVEDARACAETLVARGVALDTPPMRVPMEPGGDVTLFAVRSPDGARLEFYSA